MHMRSETQSFKFPEIVEKLPGLFVVDPSTGCAVTRQAPQPPERRSEDTSGMSVCHGAFDRVSWFFQLGRSPRKA
jgi:hypothetical protein